MPFRFKVLMNFAHSSAKTTEVTPFCLWIPEQNRPLHPPMSDSKIRSGSGDWQAEKRAFRVVLINHQRGAFGRGSSVTSRSSVLPLEASPSGRPCRSYGARLLRAGASEGPASPGLAGEALLSRDGVARRLRESAHAHSFYAHAQQPCRGPWQVRPCQEGMCAAVVAAGALRAGSLS